MTQRGRKSAAALEMLPRKTLMERPAPPAELSAAERIEWLAVVDRMPADWFTREVHPLLQQYCRNVCTIRNLTHEYEKEDLTLKERDMILAMRDRERKSMESLATKMRLTHQSRYDAKKKTGSDLPRPWE